MTQVSKIVSSFKMHYLLCQKATKHFCVMYVF